MTLTKIVTNKEVPGTNFVGILIMHGSSPKIILLRIAFGYVRSHHEWLSNFCFDWPRWNILCGDERLSVFVLWMIHDRLCVALLHQLAMLHDQHRICNFPNDIQVMGDE